MAAGERCQMQPTYQKPLFSLSFIITELCELKYLLFKYDKIQYHKNIFKKIPAVSKDARHNFLTKQNNRNRRTDKHSIV